MTDFSKTLIHWNKKTFGVMKILTTFELRHLDKIP